MAIDWIMRTITNGRKNGIQWTPWEQLDDLDYADDLALFSHDQQHMQDKTSRLAEVSAKLGLKFNIGKGRRMNTTSEVPVLVIGHQLEDVNEFMYFGNLVNKMGGTDRDVQLRIGKARGVFLC